MWNVIGLTEWSQSFGNGLVAPGHHQEVCRRRCDAPWPCWATTNMKIVPVKYIFSIERYKSQGDKSEQNWATRFSRIKDAYPNQSLCMHAPSQDYRIHGSTEATSTPNFHFPLILCIHEQKRVLKRSRMKSFFSISLRIENEP